MASVPPPPSSYRPWEDTSPATPPSLLGGRPTLPLPAPSAMTDRRPSISTSAPSPHNSRKRRRLSNERLDRLYLPGVLSSGPPSGILSVDVRDCDGSGGGSSAYRRGPDAVVLSSAYMEPLNHNPNHFSLQQPPPLPPPPPPQQQQPQSLPPPLPAPCPVTPPHDRHQFPSQPPTGLTTIVSSIHNLVLDLTSSTPSPSTKTPSQIAPHQFPSIETLTTCLETIYVLLLRLKSAQSAQQQMQFQQHNLISTEQQEAYNSNLLHLQHSLSTLRIAHSTLNTEHTNLLSAFNRSQTRTSTLDRKLLVCTEETESLANERERLMGVIEGLEETLLEVRAERDDMRLEMRKSGAQWGEIVHNAGRLEHGAGKVEKALKKGIESLRNDVERLRTAVADGGGGCCAAVGEAGERERVELKNRVRELESRLEELKSEGRRICELAEMISRTGKGIAESR